MPKLQTNGLGESLGDSLVVAGSPIYMSGQVWYVNSATGDDSYDGRSSKQPLATLEQAQTNASNYDIVVLMDGHSETYTAELAITKSLVIVAGGQSSGKPTVKFTNNQSAGKLFNITGSRVELRNIWFEEELQANTDDRVWTNGTGSRVIGCYFETDENTDAVLGSALSFDMASTEYAEVRNCTFVSTEATVGSAGGCGLNTTLDGKLMGFGNTFDAGTVGFDMGYGYREDGVNGLTAGLYLENTTLLNGADMSAHASTVGLIQVGSTAVESRVDWDGGDTYHPNGLGEALGNTLAVKGSQLWQSGQVWYVNSVTGNNSYDGRNHKEPLATLAQAQTNASNYDIVVLMDGHAETFTSSLAITKSLVIVGGGSSSGKPTVKFTNNQSNAEALTVSGDHVELRNIWFEEDGTSNNDCKVLVTGTGFRCIDCYFELDTNSDASAVGSGIRFNMAATEYAEVRNTTFVSTEATRGNSPGPGIMNEGDGRLVMVGVTFDGGTVGFDKGYAFDEDSSSAGFTAGLCAEGITMLRGADANLHANTVGYWQISSDSDEPRIRWDGGAA